MKCRLLSPTRLKTTTGFTLIELLVSMTLFAILSTVVITILVWTNNSYNRAAYLSSLQTQGSQSVEMMERAIRSSYDARIAAPGDPFCPSGSSECLVLFLAQGSLEYKATDGCPVTRYMWYGPGASGGNANRMTKRNYNQSGSSPCAGDVGGSVFDRTAGINGVDATIAPGFSRMFEKVAGPGGHEAIKINLVLKQGAADSWPSHMGVRPEVYFVTTVSLRKY